MSFCFDVKRELIGIQNAGRHCDIAELSALINTVGIIAEDTYGGHLPGLFFKTENIFIVERVRSLLNSSFDIPVCLSVTKKNKNSTRQYTLRVSGGESLTKLLSATETKPSLKGGVSALLISSECCKKAFIRGCFLTSASLSDPEKTYHAEFVFQNRDLAASVMKMINYFGLSSKIMPRKDNYVLYLKNSDQISDLFRIIEASGSMMEFENIRAYRDMNNTINRKANFDTANYDKTVSASVKQVLDIELIKKTKGLAYLPEALRDAASLRLLNNEASLKELGAMLTPPVSKSGVNHRFRKISEIAEELRN